MRELYLSSSIPTTGSGVLPASIIPAAHFSADFADTENRQALPWFALSVKHQHEKPIEAALTHKGFEAFAPTYRFSKNSIRHTPMKLAACTLKVKC